MLDRLKETIEEFRNRVETDAATMTDVPAFGPVYRALFDAIDAVTDNLRPDRPAADAPPTESPQHDRDP